MKFQQLINIFWSRKRIFLSVFMMTVITTLFVSILLPKQYVATTSVVVDQRNVDPVTGLNSPVSQLLPSYVATQVDVIKSHNVARKVLEKLELSKLKLSDNQQMKKDFPQLEKDFPDLQKKFVKAGGIGDIRDWVADLLLEKLEVKPSRESNMIQFDFASSDPQLAADIANAFADAYIQTSVELRAQPAKITADWFDSQMASLREYLEHAQSVLSTYQQQEGIVDGSDRLDIEKTRLVDLSRQLVEIQSRTNELKSRKDLLASILKQGGSFESLQEVLDSKLIQELKTELAVREAHFAEISQKFKKGNPQYNQAEAQVTSLKKEIQSAVLMVLNSINSMVTSSKQRDDMIAKALAEQKAKVLDLKKKHDQIAVLSREVESAQRTYDEVMHRAIQTRMESELSQTDISILNSAYPPQKAAKPKVLLNMILSIFLGGVLGVGAALLSELMDRRVRSAFDVSEMLGIPVFAVVSAPVAKENRMLWRFNLDKIEQRLNLFIRRINESKSI
ncbi:MAG: chain length determinant protein EpsF [Smithella sp.]|nr:chain length determinant protein EpsF [Patescibacteria group bacterium]MDD5524723.1 chain length determinant protein EpsF [Smithella sp.]